MVDPQISTFEKLGIPLAVSSVLCFGLLSLAVVAWLPVKRIWEIEISDFTSKRRRMLRWLVTPLAALALLGYSPRWDAKNYYDIETLIDGYIQTSKFKEQLAFYKSNRKDLPPERLVFSAMLDAQATPKPDPALPDQFKLYQDRRKQLEYGERRAYRYYKAHKPNDASS